MMCDGLPALDLKTPPGFCVAVVADKLRYPRGVQELPGGELAVVEMGGWVEGKGRVIVIGKDGKQRVLLDKLDRPNGIALGPDGKLYVGVVKRIVRIDPAKPGQGTDFISGLPGVGRHLLTGLRFDPRGDLYVNVGSASDHCESASGTEPAADKPCAENEGPQASGVIRKYSMSWPGGVVKTWEVYARGLRNSMAMAVHPATGELWQGENSRDNINIHMPQLKSDAELPHDELNMIRRGAHYGWPYCYDANVASPEYPAAKCASYTAPAKLLPAHAAPLGMLFYTAERFPAQYKGSLVMTFHGYRQHGHRLVALLPDKKGAPLGKMVELISGWDVKGKQGRGAPVDVKQAANGDLLLVDDHNGQLLKLHFKD